MAFINGTELEETEEGYQVYPKGGKWEIQDPYSGNVLGKPFVVSNTAHTYSKVTQECVTCYVGYMPEQVSLFGGKFCRPDLAYPCLHNFGCSVQKCDRADQGQGFVCKFDAKLKILLKGLCKESKIDTEYLLLGYEVMEKGGGHRRKYGGSTGWILDHNKDMDMWRLHHDHYPHLTITMEDKDSLPVGLHTWLAANNTCSLGQTSSVHLQLSACLPHQFTCYSGKCISLDNRCDNIEVAIEPLFGLTFPPGL